MSAKLVMKSLHLVTGDNKPLKSRKGSKKSRTRPSVTGKQQPGSGKNDAQPEGESIFARNMKYLTKERDLKAKSSFDADKILQYVTEGKQLPSKRKRKPDFEEEDFDFDQEGEQEVKKRKPKPPVYIRKR